MSLAAGRTVLGRFKLVSELPGTTDLWRWEAEDLAAGGTVEIVAPSLMAALRPLAQARFTQAGRAVSAHPAAQARLAEGVEGSLPLAARPLGQGPWPATLRLEPALVEALAGWLGGAILEAPPLEDGLRLEDIHLDADRIPRLSPLGLVHGGAIHDPPRHRPPELRQGAPATPEAALYGLGVLLFRAATGQDAVPGDTIAAWEQGLPRHAADLNPSLPASTARLLEDLLSPEPARRRAAVEGLARSPVPLPLTPEQAPARPRAASSAPTPAVAAPASARPDVGIGAWTVAVRPSDLNAPALRRAAALANAWPSALTRAGAADRWVPVFLASSQQEAEAQARRLVELGVPARLLPGDPPWGKGAGALALLLLAGLLFLAGILFFPLLLLALVALVGGGALGAAAMGVRSAQRSALLGRSALVQAMTGPDASSEPERRLAAARRTILEADLPLPAQMDLLGALDEAEDSLAATPAATRLSTADTAVRAAEAARRQLSGA